MCDGIDKIDSNYIIFILGDLNDECFLHCFFLYLVYILGSFVFFMFNRNKIKALMP